MHGSVSQWLPVSCQGVEGISVGTTMNLPGYPSRLSRPRSAWEALGAHRLGQLRPQGFERDFSVVLPVLGEAHRRYAARTHLALDHAPVAKCFGETSGGTVHRAGFYGALHK